MNSEQSLDSPQNEHVDRVDPLDQTDPAHARTQTLSNAAPDVSVPDGDTPKTTPSYYTRPRAPRLTQEAIDDLQEDEVSVYDGANAATSPIKSSVLKRRMRRISKKDQHMLNNSQYGQYLEIPRSKKTIFQSQEQAKQARTEKILISCVIVVVIALCIALRFLM